MKIKIGTTIVEMDDCKYLQYFKSQDTNGYIYVICTLIDGTNLHCDIRTKESLRTFLKGLELLTNLDVSIEELEEELNMNIIK